MNLDDLDAERFVNFEVGESSVSKEDFHTPYASLETPVSPAEKKPEGTFAVASENIPSSVASSFATATFSHELEEDRTKDLVYEPESRTADEANFETLEEALSEFIEFERNSKTSARVEKTCIEDTRWKSPTNLPSDLAYRMSCVGTPLSNYGSPTSEVVSLISEDYRSCVNKGTSESLIGAMDELRIKSAERTSKNKVSRSPLTPCVWNLRIPTISSKSLLTKVKSTEASTSEKKTGKRQIGDTRDISEIVNIDGPTEVRPEVEFPGFARGEENFDKNAGDDKNVRATEIQRQSQNSRHADEVDVETEHNSNKDDKEDEYRNSVRAIESQIRPEAMNSGDKKTGPTEISPQAKLDMKNSGFPYDIVEYKKIEKISDFTEDLDGNSSNEELAKTVEPDEVSESLKDIEKIGARGSSKDKIDDPLSKLADPTRVEADDKKKRKSQSKNSRVLASQVRRRSLKYRRSSGRFVSMAEAMLKFQKGTPKRFRSTSSRQKNTGPPQIKAVQAAQKVTRPVSPALLCKSRSRPTMLTDREERERLVIDQTRPSRFGTNPAKPKTPKKLPISGREVSSSKKHSDLSAVDEKKKFSGKATPRRKTLVKSVFSTEEGPDVRDVEIFDFGVPINSRKTVLTNPIPFSFEKREKKIHEKSVSSRNDEKRKMIFHGDAAVTSTATSGSSSRTEDEARKPIGASFRERNESLVARRKEFTDRATERVRQARVFRASLAPSIKQARGNSQNSRLAETKRKPRGLSAVGRTRGSSSSIDDRENREPNVSTIVGNESGKGFSPQRLNTNERSRKRQEFEAMMRRKAEIEEERRRDEEANRIAREKREEKELRRTMESRARPMPVFKQPKIAKSLKPLTDPQSPAWYKKK